MNLNWLGRVGQAYTKQTLWASFNGGLIAKWDEIPTAIATVYDEARGEYLDPLTNQPVQPIPRQVSIPAYFDDAPNIQYKYLDYGVRPETDAVALVPHDFPLPDTTATFYRAGQPERPYKLQGLIHKADIGIALPGMPSDVAYKVLHLRL